MLSISVLGDLIRIGVVLSPMWYALSNFHPVVTPCLVGGIALIVCRIYATIQLVREIGAGTMNRDSYARREAIGCGSSGSMHCC